jgi:hypothetical protein
MQSHKPSDEELIKDIRTRYGNVIDLERSPYVLLEIIRNYAGGVADVPDGGVSVAGVGTPPGPTPPPPPPGPSGTMGSIGNVVDNAQVMKEILKISRQLHVLTEEVGKLQRR